MTGRKGRRRKQLLDELTETRRYWKLKEEALHRTVWRTDFGRGCVPVARETAERMREINALDCWKHTDTAWIKCSVFSIKPAGKI